MRTANRRARGGTGRHYIALPRRVTGIAVTGSGAGRSRGPTLPASHDAWKVRPRQDHPAQEQPAVRRVLLHRQVEPRRGGIRRLCREIRHEICAFGRLHAEGNVLVAMNVSPDQATLRVAVDELGWEEGRTVENLLGIGRASPVHHKTITITLPPWSGTWLK